MIQCGEGPILKRYMGMALSNRANYNLNHKKAQSTKYLKKLYEWKDERRFKLGPLNPYGQKECWEGYEMDYFLWKWRMIHRLEPEALCLEPKGMESDFWEQEWAFIRNWQYIPGCSSDLLGNTYLPFGFSFSFWTEVAIVVLLSLSHHRMLGGGWARQHITSL